MSENSRLKIIKPQEITEAELVSSTIPLDDAPLWVAGTYNEDEERIYDNQVWKVAATSTDDRPDLGAEKEVATWVRMGWTNRYRMFNDGVDSRSTAATTMTAEVATGQTVSDIALLGVSGNSATVTITDPVDGVVFNETKGLTDIGVPDYWEWHYQPYQFFDEALFEPAPYYPGATIEVTIDGAGQVELGRLVLGMSTEVGITNLGTSVSNLSYSTRDRDGFGNLILKTKRTVKLVDYQVTVPTGSVSFARSLMDSLDNVPTLFSGSNAEGYGSITIFGVIQDFRLVYSGHTLSDMTLTVEGF